jgi:hypothetical protein
MERNKFFVYNKNGYIEEKAFIEKDNFLVDISPRGNICMSSKDKKTLHTIPFFDHFIDYDNMTKGKYLAERETLNSKIQKYSEEGPGFIDI